MNTELMTLKSIAMEMRSMPENPQQHIVAERINRTKIERARSMGIHVGLLKAFWTDAVNIASYSINGGPSINVFKLKHTREDLQWQIEKNSFLKMFGFLS